MPSASAPAAMTIAGGGMSAIGQMTAGQGAANASYYNAAIQQQRADQIRSETASNAQLQVEQNRRNMAQATANYGASGVDAQNGTPLEVLSDISTQGELARQLIVYRGTIGAMNAEEQAQLDLMKASSSKTAGTIGAFSTLLSSFGKAGMNGYTPTSPAGTSAGISWTDHSSDFSTWGAGGVSE